jgi:chromosome segregation ATPase
MDVKKIIIIGIIVFIGLQLGTYFLGQWQTSRNFSRQLSALKEEQSKALEGVREAKTAVTGIQKAISDVGKTLQQQHKAIERLEEADRQLYRDLQGSLQETIDTIVKAGDAVTEHTDSLETSGELLRENARILQEIGKGTHGSSD